MYNKVTLIGNLGKDVEIRQLTNTTVANLALATSETWKDATGTKQTKTSWHNVKIFGKLADVAAQYLRKGSKVLIEGKIDYTTWEKDGQKFYGTDIIASEMRMLGGNENTEQNMPQAAQLQQDEPDDLPF
jgi:single-strand DNA-binding protein